MKPKVRLLHIDDDFNSRLLVKETLQSGQCCYEVYSVDSKETLKQLIAGTTYDAVLTNFSIFGFPDLSIIKYIKEQQSEVPVIIVTEKGSEEIAVWAMRSGADDYVIKSAKHIASLDSRIQLVLEQSRVRNQHFNIQTALNESKVLFRTAFENAAIGICTITAEGNFISVNNAFCQIVGYSKEDLEQASVNDFTHEDEKKIIPSVFHHVSTLSFRFN